MALILNDKFRHTIRIKKLFVIAILLFCNVGKAELVLTQFSVGPYYTLQGNYPSATALWSACVAAVLDFKGDPKPTCGEKPTVEIQPGDYMYKWGGYFMDRLPDGSPRALYVSAWHCREDSTLRFFADINKCERITPIPVLPTTSKANGPSCPSNSQNRQPSCGNPISPVIGNKVQQELDYKAGASALPLSVERIYNSSYTSSASSVLGSFGNRWRSSIDRKIIRFPSRTKLTCSTMSVGYFCEDILIAGTEESAIIYRPDGKNFIFNKVGTGWIADADVDDRLIASYSGNGSNIVGWKYVTAENISEDYDESGKLISESNANGETLNYTYGMGNTNDTSVERYPADSPECNHVFTGVAVPNGTLLCITDRSGRQLNFEFEKDLVKRVIDPAGQSFTYSYNGISAGCIPGSSTFGLSRSCKANNLTSVLFPDGKTRTYHYNERNQINGGVSCSNSNEGSGLGYLVNSLTGITDENNSRYASWGYDCYGKAQTSEHAGGIEKIKIDFGTTAADGSRTNTVTTYGGTTATPLTIVRSYHFKSILGVGRNDSIDQPCAGCDGMKARTYDTNGNVATSTDFSGRVNTYTYNLERNLETRRVEASGTAVARTVNTEWHTTLRAPVRVAEPKRITSYTYDAQGNLLTRSIQPTGDATGASGFAASAVGIAQTWTYTYNGFGQLLTDKGPRTDVDTTVTRTYDLSGNLTTITNALGQTTTLSDYDAHGRPGRITDPNGLDTVYSYTPRGWLATVSIGVQTTSYDYDGVGQLLKVTAPDGTSLRYTYDAAHRLTKVTDSAGNTIEYTLDNLGNRTAEQVRDPAGTLARQISRVYDKLNQLKQITGALQ